MFQQKHGSENGLRGFLVGWFKFRFRYDISYMLYKIYILKQLFPFEYLMLSVVV